MLSRRRNLALGHGHSIPARAPKGVRAAISLAASQRAADLI
jgi:hypothetical protein